MPIVRIERLYYFEIYKDGRVTSRDYIGSTLKEARRNVKKVAEKRRKTK